MPSTNGFDLFEMQSARSQRRRALVRLLCMVALAVATFLIPSIGNNRTVVAAILLVAAPAPVLLVKCLPSRYALFGQSCFDVVMAGVLSWFIPNAWAAALVVISTSPAASAAITGKRFYGAISLFGLAMTGASAWVQDVKFWIAPWVVAVVLVPVIMSYVDVYLSRELSAAARLSDVVDSTSVIVWEIDALSGDIISANGRIEEILGLDLRADGAGPANVMRLMHPDDRAAVLGAGAAQTADTSRGQVRLRHVDGRYVWIRYNLKVFHTDGRRVLRGVGVDISELIAAHDETRWRAERDQLTGLANRTLMLEVLGTHLTAHTGATFFMLDLDGFKEINDTLGHHAGDQYLQVIAERLQSEVGPGELVARLGGDEFAVVGPRRDTHGEQNLAARLLDACQRPVSLEGVELAGAVSIGIAHAPEHGDDVATLMRRADVAMYAAKRNDGGIHRFDLRSDEPSGERLKLSSEVERALTGREFRLWFQPKVLIETGLIVGAEGLLRWHHPTRGVMLPVEFIDMLELSRHNRPLAHDVIAQGLAFVAQGRSGTLSSVSVNVSMRNLLEPDLTDRIALLLERHDVAAPQLVLEITEREIADERALARVDLSGLRELGVGLSIDDFGTGHSSLVRLQQMPVTELKIDHRFVSGLGVDPEAPILVRSIVELCRNLGLGCVAEGVERAEQVSILRDLGCDQAQGFFFSPAVTVEQFDSLLLPGTSPRA